MMDSEQRSAALRIALELADLDRHGTTLGQEFPESREAILAAIEGPNGRNKRASSLFEYADLTVEKSPYGFVKITVGNEWESLEDAQVGDLIAALAGMRDD